MSTPMDLKNEELQKLRTQQYELKHTVAKLESELKIHQVKSAAVQGELERLVKESKNLIVLLEKEKSQKNQLLQKDRQNAYNQSRGNVQSKRFQTLNKVMTQQNETIKSQLQLLTTEKITLIKEKQQISNKLVISESKLQALGSQEEVIKGLTNSLEITMRENEQLKYQIQTLKKKTQESSTTVKTILKDSDQTRDDLLKEFQQKIMSKELANIQMKEKYQKKIAQLNLKIAELQVRIPKE